MPQAAERVLRRAAASAEFESVRVQMKKLYARCKTPASTIPPSGSIAGGNGSRLFVALAMDWFKCDWEDREGRRLTKWSHASMVGSDGEVPVHSPPFFYRSAPACAYLTTADASNLLL